MNRLKLILAASSLALMSVSANAAVLVDASPKGSFRGTWSNHSGSQNFLVQFNLASASQLTGFEIFSGAGLGAVGDKVTVKIRRDAADKPDSSNLYSMSQTIAAVTPVSGLNSISKLTTHFVPITLEAGNYWFGVSGTNHIGWSSFHTNTQKQRLLSGDTVRYEPAIGDLGFKVLGNVSAVPEPSSWMMMILGLGVVGGSMRSRRRTAVRKAYA